MKKTLAVFIVLAAVTSIGLLRLKMRENLLKQAYDTTMMGTTKVDLLRRLGKPWAKGACGAIFGGTVSPECTTEVIYKSPYAPLLPMYWVYFFNTRGILVSKYVYVSP